MSRLVGRSIYINEDIMPSRSKVELCRSVAGWCIMLRIRMCRSIAFM